MVRELIQAGIAAVNAPDERSEEEIIWLTIRGWLVISRIATIILMILISEFTEEYYIANLSVSVWVIIISIPLFILLSFFITLGDRHYGTNSSKREGKGEINNIAQKRPIIRRK
ncbi:MAG: hypothetical protein HOE92_05930 [Euryarchaeota archaeon]|jgi:hypothetical protein|nr:hypothetical protein [Euryarchaeota archaeon]MBT3971738.1 hypothetical protein [Euryarchaeota archaeon]MBT4407480.1 hypothetical protein [Euryarchaeota archaeon]MBT6644271.1 hypothetical protein [Euryarchaeota archaeon]